MAVASSLSHERQKFQITPLTAALLLVVVGLLTYHPLFDFTFFWEDPFDIGQVDALSYRQLFLVSTNDLYYRPLLLALVKLLKGGGASFQPFPFYLLNVAARIGATLLIYGGGRRWFRSEAAALGGALIFLLNPITLDATAKAMSAHAPALLPIVAALWLYTIGREERRQGPVLAGLLLQVMGLFIHENVVLLPLFVLLLELFLVARGRVQRFSYAALLYWLPALLYVPLWLSIPKSGSLLSGAPSLTAFLYLSQSLTFPLARLLSFTGSLSVSQEGQAALGLGLSLSVLLMLTGEKRRPMVLFGLGCWVAASGLLWLTLSLDYLWIGSRLLYLPSFAAALVWGNVLTGTPQLGKWLRWRPAASTLLVALILTQSGLTLARMIPLYAEGSSLMRQIVATGSAGERLLYVNVPDRFQLKEPLYPLGFWGVVLAPVSQELSDFISLSTGATVESESVSAFPLLQDQMAQSPYQVNTRGGDAYASAELYEAVLWADQSYLVDYGPAGDLTLKTAGTIQPWVPAGEGLGHFAVGVQLMATEAARQGDDLQLTLRWTATEPLPPEATVFVHVLNEAGDLVLQADGPPLSGLLLLPMWRPGHTIVDRRLLAQAGTLPPGDYLVQVGVYNWVSGERAQARLPDGERTPNDAVKVHGFSTGE